MSQKQAQQPENDASYALSIWRTEAPANRFLQYEPGEVAARFLLPICVSSWGYDPEQFYNAEAVAEARAETGGSGFENYTLREDLWLSLNRGEPLALRDDSAERQITIAELRAILDEAFVQLVQPAFKARDAEAMREAADWAMRLRVEERHSGGPIRIAQAAEALMSFQARLYAAQSELRAEMQQRAGHLFAEEELGSLGQSVSPDRGSDDGGPYWRLCESGILRGAYATYEDAEIAELALNILNLLCADRAARHPKLVRAAHLRHYIGRYLAAPGIRPDSFVCDDRLTGDLEETDDSPLPEQRSSQSDRTEISSSR